MNEKIFILDSGYNRTTEKRICNYIVENDKVKRVDNDTDRLGHGTQITDIIQSAVPEDVNVIKIFDENYSCNISYLLCALRYINELDDVYLVHMSLGVKLFNAELFELCHQLYKKGTLIVSAFDNNKTISYPAAFPFVIGVMASYRCLKPTDFVYVRNSVVNIKTKGHGQTLVTKNNKKISMDIGNSYAAAYVTREILKQKKKFNFESALAHFEAKAVFEYDFPNYNCDKFNLSEINKAAVFPYNKENRSLLKYSDKLLFDIVDFYDVKYSGLVSTEHISFSQKKKYIIRDIKACNWSSFDTFILGHVWELGVVCNFDFKKYILDLCLINDKNVYMYDDELFDEYIDKFNEKGLHLYCAETKYNDSNKFRMLNHFRTPIILFLGTSGKQGKFTLQLQIRYILKDHNINIGQIGTEPSSLLYGMDDMITTGYFSKGKIDSNVFVETVSDKIHNLDIGNNQLILLGSQSAFLPRRIDNAERIDEKQFLMLLSSMPDGVILSVNYSDPIEYIQKSINTIENMTNTKVFLLALYAYDMIYEHVIDSNKRRLSASEIEKAKEKLSVFNIPVIVSGEQYENEHIFEIIVDYFSN